MEHRPHIVVVEDEATQRPSAGGLSSSPEFSSQRCKWGRRFAEARGARSSSARAARCRFAG